MILDIYRYITKNNNYYTQSRLNNIVFFFSNEIVLYTQINSCGIL